MSDGYLDWLIRQRDAARKVRDGSLISSTWAGAAEAYTKAIRELRRRLDDAKPDAADLSDGLHESPASDTA